MRSCEKKKAFRLMIKANIRKGLINEPSGAWTTNTQKNAMGRDIKGGHRCA